MAGDEELAVARVIKSFLSDPDSVVLMQETQLQIADRFSTLVSYKDVQWNLLVSYKDELYWAVAGPELATLSDEQMFTLLKSPSTNPFSAFFYLGTVPPSKTLTDGDLDQILTRLVGIAVDALDFESFLLWWREDLRPFPAVETR